MAFHPLRDLTADEINQAASLIKRLHKEQALVFKAITLEEPQKDLELNYFKAQEDGTALPVAPRVVFAAHYFKNTGSRHSSLKLTQERTVLLHLTSISLMIPSTARKE